MYRSLFHHELGLMIRSKKNVFFIVFLFIALLGYCLIMLPDKQTVHVLDHEQLKADIQLNEVLLDYRLREGYTGFNSFTKKSFYAELQYYNQLSSKLIHAYENGDPNRYLRLKMEYDLFFYTVTSDPSMFEGSTYPRMDMMHFEYYTYHRYQALLHNDLPLTFSMIEQKSAIQVFEHLLLVGGPLILFLAIYFSSDILLRDRRHPTIKQGLPIGLVLNHEYKKWSGISLHTRCNSWSVSFWTCFTYTFKWVR
ncbi:hypothetical protein [Alkalicoccobacillus plakortidis]|uniref:DUF1461 domain-containing protein n=1 Tax=Alkalicoccobacillus plakortidis TaxID=444060 RepID=A0ABT0XKK7_9BACI|nr:hypothetical protein [Alkalicoccobacillus plakortidis]MCM2676275.1 hypothetical protein [Alkalicoccobacillus plakortidis]